MVQNSLVVNDSMSSLPIFAFGLSLFVGNRFVTAFFCFFRS